MNFKKITAILLVLTMTLCVLSACGSSTEGANGTVEGGNDDISDKTTQNGHEKQQLVFNSDRITEEEWNAAISAENFKNATIHQLEATGEESIYKCDGKNLMTQIMTRSGDVTEYSYVKNGWWYITKITDGVQKTEYRDEYYHEVDEPAKQFPVVALNYLKDAYSEAIYDDANKCYVLDFTDSDFNIDKLEISFNDGKIKSSRVSFYNSDGEAYWVEQTFTDYGVTEIDIPEIEPEFEGSDLQPITYGEKSLKIIEYASKAYGIVQEQKDAEYINDEYFDGYEFAEIKLYRERHLDPNVNVAVYDTTDRDGNPMTCYAFNIRWEKEGADDIVYNMLFSTKNDLFAELCEVLEVPSDDLSQFVLTKSDILALSKMDNYFLQESVMGSISYLGLSSEFETIEAMNE